MQTEQIHKHRWSKEEDRRLIELHDAGKSWSEIADELNRISPITRRGPSCSGRYKRIVPRHMRSRIVDTSHRWTDEQEEALEEMLRQRVRPREIAKALGKKLRAVHNKIQYRREIRNVSHVDTAARIYVPPHVFEERDRRIYALRDLTALLCGDPAPGQSALDKKQGAFA